MATSTISFLNVTKTAGLENKLTISSLIFSFNPPKNIRKPKVFWEKGVNTGNALKQLNILVHEITFESELRLFFLIGAGATAFNAFINPLESDTTKTVKCLISIC